MNLKSLVLLILCALMLFQCKSEDPNATKTLPAKEINPSLSKENYNKNKSSSTASKYITDVIKVAMKEDTSDDKKRQLLTDAINVAEESKSTNLKGSLLNTYVRTLGPSDDPSKVLALANILKGANAEAADLLLFGYSKLDVSAEEKTKALGMMATSFTDPVARIKQLRDAINSDPSKFSVNEANARTYVDACEAYAMSMPDAADTPLNLFNAAEVAKSIKSYNKSFALFDWLMEKYPNDPKAPTGLFLKGFILENELNNDNGAKVYYEEFIEKYPSHDLADDVEFLLANLGKSDEEILKMIEAKKQQ